MTAETRPPNPIAPSFKFLPVNFEYIYDPYEAGNRSPKVLSIVR